MPNCLYIHFHKESEFGTRSDKGLHILKPDQRALDDAVDQIGRGGWEDVHLYNDAWSSLKAWKEPDSYAGHQFYGYVGLCGQSRDSDLVERANWSAIKDDAEGRSFARDSVTIDDEDIPYLETTRASHWACGWVETMMVYWASVDALDFAAAVRDTLEENALYDDSAYSELECEEQEETFNNNKDSFMRTVAKFLLGREADIEEEFSKEELKHLEDVAWRLYSYDCGYGGTEDGWVSLDDIAHHTNDERYDLSFMARDGNTIARRLLRKAGVKMTPKAKLGVL